MAAERLPLTSMTSPACNSPASQRAQVAWSGKRRATRAGGVRDAIRARADGADKVDAEAGGRLADHRVAFVAEGSEFAHGTEHGDAAGVGRLGGQGLQGGGHGVRIGVVGVVDDGHAAPAFDLEAALGQLALAQAVRGFGQRDALDDARRHGQQRVLHHVQAGHRQGNIGVITAVRRAEAQAAVRCGRDVFRAQVAAAEANGKHPAGRAGDGLFRERGLKVDDGHALRPETVEQAHLFLGDGLARAEELDVRRCPWW